MSQNRPSTPRQPRRLCVRDAPNLVTAQVGRLLRKGMAKNKKIISGMEEGVFLQKKLACHKSVLDIKKSYDSLLRFRSKSRDGLSFSYVTHECTCHQAVYEDRKKINS